MYSKLPKRVAIGYFSEENARQVAFDISEMLSEMPNGTPTIYFLPPGVEEAYIVTPALDGNTLTWTVSAVDTSVTGLGACQIMLAEGTTPGKILLSQVIPVDVGDSLVNGYEEPPEGYDSWIAQATAALAKLEGITVAGTAGESAAAVLTETNGHYHIAFTLPRGEQGIQGPQGASGSISNNTATVTLAAASWNSSFNQTVSVQGVSPTSVVIVSPAPSSYEAYAEAWVRCTELGAGTMTFACAGAPNVDLTVNIIIM